MIRFSEMKLKKKLIISLLSFVFVPMILFCILFVTLTLNNELRSLERVQIKENQKSAEKLETLFEYSDTMYFNLLYEHYVGFFIDETASMLQYYELSQYFDDLFERYPYYVNFVIYNHQGIKYQRGLHLESVSNNILENEILSEDSYWTKPHKMSVSPIYEFSEIDVISYSYKLAKYKTKGREIYGVFEINFDPQKMYEEVFSRTDLLNEEIYLLDKDGNIFLGPQGTSLGKRIEEYQQLKASLNEEKGMFYTYFDDKMQLCYFQSVANASFYILRFISIGEIIKMHLSVLMIVVFIAILCLVFGLLFSIIQERHIIDPLAEISVELEKIEQGNFSIHLPGNSKDEIGDLRLRVLKMSEKLESLIEENYIRTIKEQEAEMNALVTQINPHFLYNTLDSIHWMAIREKNYMISEQIEALSAMFRHILNKGKNTITIGEEIAFLKSYFLIMNKRYNDTVQLYIEIDEEHYQELKQCPILKLLIQPLVENCFVHGLKNIEKNGMVVIRFYTADRYLYIEVEDNGTGIDSNILECRSEKDDLSNKYSAINNIYERIKLFYGKEYGMHIEGKEGKGTCIILKLPCQRNSEEGSVKNYENDDHR